MRFGDGRLYIVLSPSFSGRGTIPYRPSSKRKTYQIRLRNERFPKPKKMKQITYKCYSRCKVCGV